MKFETYLRHVGRNIKAARIRCGLKQIEVHEQGGLTYRHYQDIEAGAVNITLETLYRLSNLYHVSVAELVATDPLDGSRATPSPRRASSRRGARAT